MPTRVANRRKNVSDPQCCPPKGEQQVQKRAPVWSWSMFGPDFDTILPTWPEKGSEANPQQSRRSCAARRPHAPIASRAPLARLLPAAWAPLALSPGAASASLGRRSCAAGAPFGGRSDASGAPLARWPEQTPESAASDRPLQAQGSQPRAKELACKLCGSCCQLPGSIEIGPSLADIGIDLASPAVEPGAKHTYSGQSWQIRPSVERFGPHRARFWHGMEWRGSDSSSTVTSGLLLPHASMAP